MLHTRFPLTDLGKTLEEKLDVCINDAVIPLTEGRGSTIELQLNDQQLQAGSIIYRAEMEKTPRRLFVLKDPATGDLLAYIDLGLDYSKRLGICGDMRSPNAPTTLGDLKKLNRANDGYACCTDTGVGSLLVGLALYTLSQEGITTLKVVEFTPNENANGAFDNDGSQRSDFISHSYSHVTPEIRALVATALGVTPDY